MRRKPSNAQRRVRSVHEPRTIVALYQRWIRSLLASFHGDVERLLFPVLQDATVRTDAIASEQLRRRIENLEVWLGEKFKTEKLGKGIDVVSGKVQKHSYVETKRIIAINICKVDPAIVALADGFRATNVNLIKSLVGTELKQITGILDAGETVGKRVEDIRSEIIDRFGVSESKADLLARDQVLKFNAQTAQQRMVNVGVEEYVWTVSGPEASKDNPHGVRPVHYALDGQTFRFDDPPEVSEDGRRENPGLDYQCRCTANPILPSLD